ncbi:MAG: hypothetical protein ACLQIB_40210, partial [Isosphaeraceae bacterium]
PFQPDDQIQFDLAEYSTPAPRASGASCANCNRPIADAYFEIGGKVVCGPCRLRIEEAYRGGSRLARGMRSLLYGMLAALAGAVVYYMIVRVTGYNIGLIAIVVGVMVGGGVRAGSGNRGGRFYQLLALFLTYSSIVAMNVPFLFEGALQQAKQGKKQENASRIGSQPDSAKSKTQLKSSETVAKGPAQPIADGPPGLAQDGARPAARGDPGSSEKRAAEAKKAPDAAEPPSLAGLLMSLLILTGFMFIYPVYESFHAPIAGFIYAFALWEAWKTNKKVYLTFNGPFRVSASPEGGVPPEVVGDGA